MAALAAALSERQTAAAEEKRRYRSSRPRLVADPTTSVQDIYAFLFNYLRYKKTSDLTLSSTFRPSASDMASDSAWLLVGENCWAAF